MKLLLTSSGLNSREIGKEFIGLLERKGKGSKILVIHTAQNQEQLDYVKVAGREISESGVADTNVNYLNIAKKKTYLSLTRYDAVYVCGGNTYYILDRIRKTGLAENLREFVKIGGLYIGVSAGSIIAGRDISIAGWGSEGDPNDINLKDLTGLGFTNIAVFPHYQGKLKQEVEDFKSIADYPVEVLRDGEAIVIDNGKMRVIRRN